MHYIEVLHDLIFIFALQRQDPHLSTEVQRFVYSCPLTPGAKTLRDIIPAEL